MCSDSFVIQEMLSFADNIIVNKFSSYIFSLNTSVIGIEDIDINDIILFWLDQKYWLTVHGYKDCYISLLS